MGGDRLGDDNFEPVLAAGQAGAGWALGRLWEAYAGPVTGYLRLQRVSDPEALTSDVFLGAFRTLAGFSGTEAAFRSWLFTIAHRRVLDERRAQRRRPSPEPLDESYDPEVPGPEGEALTHLATARVRALCHRLADDQRDVLLLRLLAGFTVEEVAASLGKSAGAVKALQRRGLLALRTILEREGVPL